MMIVSSTNTALLVAVVALYQLLLLLRKAIQNRRRQSRHSPFMKCQNHWSSTITAIVVSKKRNKSFRIHSNLNKEFLSSIHTLTGHMMNHSMKYIIWIDNGLNKIVHTSIVKIWWNFYYPHWIGFNRNRTIIFIMTFVRSQYCINLVICIKHERHNFIPPITHTPNVCDTPTYPSYRRCE